MRQVTGLGGKYKRRDILERGHRRIARVGKRLEQFGHVIPRSGAPALEQDVDKSPFALADLWAVCFEASGGRESPDEVAAAQSGD
jgi:hypothetical protein